MMREKFLRLLNIAIFALVLLLLTSAQTSLWMQIFGYFPAPLLWLPIIAYVAINRTPLETIIITQIFSLIMAPATVMPEGLLMICNLGVALSVQVFKTRIYWNAATYIMMVSGGSVVLFHLLHMLGSFMVRMPDYQPLTSPSLSDWIVQAMLTPLAAPPIIWLLSFIDRLTGREMAVENMEDSWGGSR
ncbi:MAG TPA: hypothetical protein PLZ57_02590 [Pseudobdellovibrionaceae bacterium]|nr:hypothetical protein [Pseudobdellovibrionaceae bacterium]